MEEQQPKKLREELAGDTLKYIATALGLVVGLAWNDAIGALIKYIFPLDSNGILAKFIYAIVLTIAVMLVVRYVLRHFSRS